MDNKKEDSYISLCLLVGTIVCTLLSTPMINAHFREAMAKNPLLPSIQLLFFIEILKVTFFSWLAVTAGKRWAAFMKVLYIGMLLGLIGFIVRLAAGFLLGERSILGTLEKYNHGQSPLIVPNAIFYQFSVTLWFGWGILSFAAHSISKLTSLSRTMVFLWANTIASLAFGLFACLSVYSPHHGEVGASKYVAEAFLLYALPNFFFCIGIRRWGLFSAMIGVATGTVLGAIVVAAS